MAPNPGNPWIGRGREESPGIVNMNCHSVIWIINWYSWFYNIIGLIYILNIIKLGISIDNSDHWP